MASLLEKLTIRNLPGRCPLMALHMTKRREASGPGKGEGKGGGLEEGLEVERVTYD